MKVAKCSSMVPSPGWTWFYFSDCAALQLCVVLPQQAENVVTVLLLLFIMCNLIKILLSRLILSTIIIFFQHFVCAKCEKPFLGHRHYEKKGLAYCETHYHQVCVVHFE